VSRCAASLIILGYNPSALTRRCLEALGPTPEDWEVLLVDNASTDDTPDLGREFAARLPRFRYLRLDPGASFARANNLAATEARGERLVFLNNDVEVDGQALAALLGTHDGPRAAGIAGGRLLYPGRTRVQHGGIRPMLWGYVSNWGVGGEPDDARWSEAGGRFGVTGAMLSIDRALFARLGGFDEGYQWGYEDIDLCLAATQAGARVVYEPAATGVHAESVSLGAAGHLRGRDENYARYRTKWRQVLEPLEHRFVSGLRESGAERLVIFGAGSAGRALADQLRRHGFDVRAFTASAGRPAPAADLPFVALSDLDPSAYDRLVIGTQAFPEVEALLHPLDPSGRALLPVLD
jgi:GT2 family glycosyltransferase